jgi:DNA-binding CsgD family transcriptional regulator
MARTGLVGRHQECRRIDALLDSARQGGGEALILRGEPGIGKTALLDYAVGEAADLRALRTCGYESESEIPFAGLADLLHPVISHVGSLPVPQRAALVGTLAIGPAAPAGRFTVCVATLGLLSAAAEERPLLIVVDDAHWLDPSSAQAIRFTARRLRAEGIALLIATRPTDAGRRDDAGIAELEISGLGFEPARVLMTRHSPRRLTDAQMQRLFSLTKGNPLALTEIPGLLNGDTATHALEPLHVGARLEQAFQRRVEGLPYPSRSALVVVAADQSGRLGPVAVALEHLQLGLVALEPAEMAGIVHIDADDVTFQHPLLRSATYHRAPVATRRAAHTALAEAYGRLPGDHAADARAWHLAIATLAPDSVVAGELHDAGVRARHRGAYIEAARAFKRAADLSTDGDDRARRLVAAAKSWQLAGRVDLAQDLLTAALDLTSDPAARAQVQHLRGYVRMWREAPSGVSSLLEREAALVESLDPDRAALMLADAAVPAFMIGDFPRALDVAQRAHAVSRHAGTLAQRVADLTLAVARVTRGDRAGGRSLLESCREWLERGSPLRHPQETIFAVITWMWLEDFATAQQLIARLITECRRDSALGVLPYALGLGAAVDYRTGQWKSGIARAGESVRLADETRQANAYGVFFLAHIQATMGQRGLAERHLQQAEDNARLYGVDCLPIYTWAARGLLALGLGNVDDAITHLERVADLADRQGLVDPTISPWPPDLIEALVRAGRQRDAAQTLDRWLTPAAEAGSRLAAATGARARGLIDGTLDAATHFEEALRIHEDLPCPFERARTLLCYGEVLRRNRRRGDARLRLREALRMFDQLEAAPWIERARAELRATGETARKRVPSTAFELTPQELQIALMVAGGASNTDVAAALFLSAKTVEYHLSKTYRKIGVSSRAALATRLAEASSGLAS